MQTVFIDLWNVITLSLSSPLREKSIPRILESRNDTLNYQSYNVSEKDDEHQYTDDFINFLKGQVEIYRAEANKKDNINLSVPYQCILCFCGLLIIVAITGLVGFSLVFKDPLTYAQKSFVDICVNLLVSISGAFVGLVGGKAMK
jgi:hypothetical protein